MTFGGPVVNSIVNYYESNRVSPVYYGLEGSTLYWHSRQGTRIDQSALSFSDMSGGHADMFVVEIFTDNHGNTVVMLYGYGWKGTFAAGMFFRSVMLPNLSQYKGSYYIFKWNDKNGDGFVDLNEITPIPVAYG